MREILFRGKRIDNGEWVEGGYKCEKVGEYFTAVFIVEHLTSGVWENHRVSPETVGQFTGLYDKNGKKIFEGDIMEGYNMLHPDRKTYQVVYEDNGFYYCDCTGCTWHPEYIDNCKLIGNIHDHPELLKGEKE